jgi:hypothetical protein
VDTLTAQIYRLLVARKHGHHERSKFLEIDAAKEPFHGLEEAGGGGAGGQRSTGSPWRETGEQGTNVPEKIFSPTIERIRIAWGLPVSTRCTSRWMRSNWTVHII